MTADSSSRSAEPHLAYDQLRAYVAGELPQDIIQRAEKHLLNCEHCSLRLDSMAESTTEFAKQIKSLLSRRAVDDTVAGGEESTGSSSIVSWSSVSSGPDAERRRFRKQKIIGQGGMGEIWQAYDCLIRRPVALKQLRQEKAYSPKHLARFQREVMLTAKLSHPGTVFVIDYSAQPGNAYYVMNLVQGGTLRGMIDQYHLDRRSGSETFADYMALLNAFVSVCNTIAYAHTQGVLHRDIKSENVMVGRFGQVTLLDWGLAKSFDADDRSADEASELTEGELPEPVPFSVRTTIEGQSLGTPAFMSPEQATGSLDEIDVRTDTYMLCGMLYEVLTGHAPFDGEDVGSVIEMVIRESPKLASEHVSDCPAPLEQVCKIGLSKDRDDRFQTAAELTDQVQNWITGRANRVKADEFFERCFELAFDVMGIVDFRRGLQNLNAAWQPMFGWAPAEITGRTHYEMIHPDDQVSAARALSRANRSKQPQQVTVRMLCKDGRYQKSIWNLAPYVEEASVLIIGRRLD